MGNVINKSFARYKKQKQEERVIAKKIRERWQKKNIKKVDSLTLARLSLRRDDLGKKARGERKRRNAAMIRRRVIGSKVVKKKVATRRRVSSTTTKRKTRRKAATPKRKANAFRTVWR